MWGKIASLFTGGLGATAQGISRAVATFTGDKVQREANAHSENMALREMVAAENAAYRFSYWDSLVDGLNRLVRPIFTYGCIGLFAMAIIDPFLFVEWMNALNLVPEPLWILMGTVVAFWFGTRTLEGMKAPKIAPGAVRKVLNNAKKIRAMRPKDRLSDEDYAAEMGDAEEPLGLPAIVAWNRKNNPQYRER